MNSDTIRRLVREVLSEELARLKGGTGAHARAVPRPAVREEVVAIANSAELMGFVHRLLDIAKDGSARREIEDGRWVFRLAGGGAGTGLVDARAAAPASGGGQATIEQGLVSERQIDALPKETRRLVLGRRARLTPLARDRVRQRGIEIERSG